MNEDIQRRWQHHKRDGGKLSLEAFGKRCEKRDATKSGEPNWNKKCVVCGQLPTVGDLDLCGPCCFGESDTAGGNW